MHIFVESSVFILFLGRDECDKMIELIKSRVTDSTFPEARENGSPEEIPSRNAGIGHDFTGAWRSMSRDRNFSKSVPFSSMKPGSFSPGSPLQASPELCTAAVTEAKKWLEEKRQGLGLKAVDNGTCTLNTDILSSVSINIYSHCSLQAICFLLQHNQLLVINHLCRALTLTWVLQLM